MKLLSIIPARGGSKRLPGKNAKILGGRPLVTWSIEAAREHSQIVATLVSTDSPEIAQIALSAGASVPWLRPSHLATDAASSVDVCLHALDYYESEHGEVDGVLLLQPTSPYRKNETLAKAIKLFHRRPDESVIAVSPAKISPYWCFHISNGVLRPIMGEANLHKRSQDLSPAYVVSGSFYLTPPSVLRQQKTLFSFDSQPVVLSSAKESVDIDSSEDWELAEYYLGKDF
jgi:CMP-N,N'-diacetyllegionaminic acid synthase